ncbi:hypothetical protein K9U39_19870 [Rhodoblastus acidophilus]|uniref:PhoU domain-containing protein n=1 Tax=Candidatus Rhodoblastus alkanivorans TaxID=2954117 RepID=A0ABS9ZBB5_9HYPH|nr:hypothetical protein [Candidatus Rhodoblastus alkanivorans]MCI4680620.1 hypothetical protein [Candidatus Rhodoblastus alkanivorans]MCI4684938.1 hypothetical protein [Candidatus Rhodoblastus alkanivorans]MDI4643153.1 hypothetical protein [Rhodoblastus acidophilus]
MSDPRRLQLRQTVAAHDKMLDGMIDEFFSAASTCLTPLVHSSQRTLDIIVLQDRWIEKSVRHTRDSLRLITCAPAVP